MNIFDNILNNIHINDIKISIKDNNITQGLYQFDKNMNSKNKQISDIYVRLDKDKKKYKIEIAYNYIKFDYFADIINSLDIFKEINLENIKYLNLSNLDLKNIDFLQNNSFKNLTSLDLSNNKIQDISIFENIPFIGLKILNLSHNHITKGLKVLKKEFFTKCVFVKINIISSQEKKISILFGKPKYEIDIYIDDIKKLKNIFENYNNFITINPFNYYNNIGIGLRQNELNYYVIKYVK